MFHQFQNQFQGFGAGNVENVPNNNAMLNHFQTNLGVGPHSLLSQMQSNQCAIALSKRTDWASCFIADCRHSTRRRSSIQLTSITIPLLESPAAQRGALATRQSERLVFRFNTPMTI